MAIKARIKAKIPANLLGSNGISATKANGAWTIAPSVGSLTATSSIAAGDRDNMFVSIYNSDGTPTYSRASLDTLLTTIVAGLDATLVSLAAANPTTNQGIYFSASETAATYSLTAGGRALGGVTGATDTLPYFDGASTATTTAITAFGRTLIDDAAASNARTTLGLVIGTDVQAYDATLLSIAALGTAADRIAYTTGIDTWAEATVTSYGRSLIDDADAGTAQTTLGISTFVKTILDDADAAAVRATIGVGLGTGDLVAANNLSDVASAATSFTNLKQAASDTDTGVIEIAIQSEMETGTDTGRAVVPGRQHYHPSAAKWWAVVTYSAGTPTLQTSFNVTSIADTAVGQCTVTIATDFSTANWAPWSSGSVVSGYESFTFTSKAAGSVVLNCVTLQTGSQAFADPANFSGGGFGSQ